MILYTHPVHKECTVSAIFTIYYLFNITFLMNHVNVECVPL